MYDPKKQIAPLMVGMEKVLTCAYNCGYRDGDRASLLYDVVRDAVKAFEAGDAQLAADILKKHIGE